jgi:hypothetical protein
MRNAVRKGRLIGALMGTMALLVLGLVVGPVSAQASTSPYCGGVLPSYGGCFGAARWLYQTYGWGDQTGVCVTLGRGREYLCSFHPNEGVYSPNAGSNIWSEPGIMNPGIVSNYVHGVALTH